MSITKLLRNIQVMSKTLPNKAANMTLNVLSALYIGGLVKDSVISILKTGEIPKHIALIMDGNRTYARNNNLPFKDGHSAGAESLSEVLEVAYRVGVEHVTIYAFSIENFKRPKEEVDILFALLRDRLRFLSEHESSYAEINELRIKIVGNRSMIPKDILHDLEQIEQKTASAKKRVLNVCFPYTTRDDITHTIKTLVQKRVDGEIQPGDISSEELTKNLYFGPDTPPLDLLVRTSGHRRLSDFMMWQCADDCSIMFVEYLWPDFRFFATAKVLLTWSYYRTLQIQQEQSMGKQPNNEKLKVLLESLPEPPEFCTVAG